MNTFCEVVIDCAGLFELKFISRFFIVQNSSKNNKVVFNFMVQLDTNPSTTKLLIFTRLNDFKGSR